MDELRDVRRRPWFVRIDAALGGKKYGIFPPSAASMRADRGPTSHVAPFVYTHSTWI